MFKRRTLFVVGAGASNEVGFPTGPKLASTISDNLEFTNEDRRGPSDFRDHELHIEIRRKLVGQTPHEQLSNYMRAAKRIHEGVALSFSIDDFLSVHRDDPYIVELGKAGRAHQFDIG
jgi:hypothetical protein